MTELYELYLNKRKEIGVKLYSIFMKTFLRLVLVFFV